MFAAVSLPGTAGLAKCCLLFTVALLHQYETCCSSFEPEWVCRWETSLADWVVLPDLDLDEQRPFFILGK